MKYFFGYTAWQGRIIPQKWIEENGRAIGSPMVVLQAKEISESVYNLSLSELQGMMDYKPN